jgi:hypothetical protein
VAGRGRTGTINSCGGLFWVVLGPAGRYCREQTPCQRGDSPHGISDQGIAKSMRHSVRGARRRAPAVVPKVVLLHLLEHGRGERLPRTRLHVCGGKESTREGRCVPACARVHACADVLCVRGCLVGWRGVMTSGAQALEPVNCRCCWSSGYGISGEAAAHTRPRGCPGEPSLLGPGWRGESPWHA